MKKLFTAFLAFVMMISCIAGVDFTASAAEEFTYVDENGYTCIETLPEKPSYFAANLTGPSFIRLEWSLSYGAFADGVQLSLYDKETKKYVSFKYLTSDKTSYRYCDLAENTAYTFRIRPYVIRNGVKYYGEDLKCTARTSPVKTSLVSVSYVSTGKIKVSWKKTEGVSGYVIKYSTSSKVSNNSTTCTLVVSGAGNTSRTISGLAGKKYYVKVCTYKLLNNYKYCSEYSDVKSVTVKKGASVKTMLNAIKTDTSGRSSILELTAKGVDISKYSTTYDRVKAIYNWHSKHNTDYGWSCMECNINFNDCLSYLFQNSNKTYDKYIYLAAGDVKNNDGSVVMHKWSVIYLAGVPYIFDPRLQGYTSNKTGSDYFGISKGSSKSKMYLFDSYMFYWCYSANEYKYAEYLVQTEAKPATVTVKSATAVTNGFKLSWNTVSSCSGYKIAYSTSSKFSSCKYAYVEDKAAVSKTIKGLGSGKTYYVKIKAYKQYGNTKYYGSYSDAVKVKTK